MGTLETQEQPVSKLSGRRRWRRMASRLAILLFAVACGVFIPAALVVRRLVVERQDRAVIEYVRSVGGTVKTVRIEHGLMFDLFRPDDARAVVAVQTGPKKFDVSRLAELRYLQQLTLAAPDVSSDDLMHVARVAGLESLSIASDSIRDGDLRHLSRLSGLRTLTLGSPLITDDGILHLIPLVELRHIRLEQARLGEFGFRDLGQLTLLKSIELPATNVDEDALIRLAALEHLQSLQIGPPVGIGGDGSHWIKTSPIRTWRNRSRFPRQLARQHLDVPPAAESILSEFSHYEDLRRISIASSGIDGAGVAHLKRLIGLQNLVLEDLHVTDDGLRHLAELTRLRQLALAGTPIGDAGLSELRESDDFVELVLVDTNVTDQGLELFADSANLVSVKCIGPNVTDRAIEAVAALPRLKSLNLNDHRDRDRDYAIRNPEGVRQIELKSDGNWSEIAESLAVLNQPFSLTTWGDGFEGASDFLPAVKRLQSLHVWQYAGQVRPLLKFSNLEKLGLHAAELGTDGFALLCGMPSLRELNLAGANLNRTESPPRRLQSSIEDLNLKNTALNAEALEIVTRLPALRKLNLSVKEWPGCDLTRVRDCPALEELDFGRFPGADLDGNMYVALSTMDGLKRLTLPDDRVFPEQAFAHLAKMPQLQELNLRGGRKMNDLTAVSPLSSCRALKALRIWQRNIAGQGLAELVNCETLEELDLTGSKIKTSDLECLSQFPNLRRLNLTGVTVVDGWARMDGEGPHVSDRDLKHLVDIRSLSQLKLSHRGISNDGIDRLKQALPNTSISFNPRDITPLW